MSKRRIAILLILSLSLLSFGTAPSPIPSLISTPVYVNLKGTDRYPLFTGCGPQIAPEFNPAFEQEVVELVNQERDAASLPPLKRVSMLDDAARFHAKDMADEDYFNHDTYDGGVRICDFGQRVANFGYTWNTAGENIAAGYGTPQAVMDAWMDSPGHQANILRDSFEELGVGYAEGSGVYFRYWVQDFGRRDNVDPLIINREAAVTGDRSVSIYLYGSYTEMRLKNDGGAYGSWQAFSNSFSWQIGEGNGLHTVTAEMRTGGTTVTSSDSIELDGTPQLGNLPASVTFLSSIPDRDVFPLQVTVLPEDIGTGQTFTWSAENYENWLQISPPSGTYPQTFSITIPGASSLPAGVYSDIIIVTGPLGMLGSPAQIQVTLVVINSSIQQIHLPAVER